MRILAEKSAIGISSIYHFFEDKDVLLTDVFDSTSANLGIQRAKLSTDKNFSELLYDRIEYQFKHIEDVNFVLKYYLHFREKFPKQSIGYLPEKAYLHIREILQLGVSSGELTISPTDIDENAKVITHAINGFLLEYYPLSPNKAELKVIITQIHRFIMRGLTANCGGYHDVAVG